MNKSTIRTLGLLACLLAGSSQATPGASAQQEQEAEAPVEAPVTPVTTPLAPSSAEDIRQALLAASSNEVALRRLIDPQWGVGSYDPDRSGVRQHCSEESFTTHSGLAFLVHEEDTFRCDRSLRRCSFADPHSGGYVFHFRDGPGEAIFLNAIIHHQSRVPSIDSATVRNFVRNGEGVCALWRSLTSAEASPPSRLSVFVASHTGLVESTLREHRCGEQAAAAYAERIAPIASSGAPSRCERNPARCLYSSRDVLTTIHGEAGAPTAVVVTRPGMYPNLERAQQREVNSFLQSLRRRRCDGD